MHIFIFDIFILFLFISYIIFNLFYSKKSKEVQKISPIIYTSPLNIEYSIPLLHIIIWYKQKITNHSTQKIQVSIPFLPSNFLPNHQLLTLIHPINRSMEFRALGFAITQKTALQNREQYTIFFILF
jgi:hypothetical protein